MIWLNASLAFALAMIIFCTMVTAITEAIHQFFHMRQGGLERMLDQLFENVIWPRVAPTVNATKDKIKEDFLETLLSNPAIEQHDGWFSWLRLWFAPRQVNALTLTQFVDRLVDTDLGAHLWLCGRQYATRVVDDVTRRFERFEEGATSYFARRAQMVSLFVAIGLAFALNVDAIRLFKAFLTDQQLTARVLKEADSITATYQKQQAEHLPSATPPAASEESPPAPAAAPGGAELPPASTPSAAAADAADVEALKQQATFLNQQIAVSTALGLPIGGAYYPWCLDEIHQPTCNEPLSWDALSKASVSTQSAQRFLRWFLCVLLAGVLIGLGGPFWFDAFTNLAAFVRLLGGPAKPAQPQATGTSTPTAAAAVEPPPKPATPGQAFATAAETAAPKLAPGRVLLTPSGRRL